MSKAGNIAAESITKLAAAGTAAAAAIGLAVNQAIDFNIELTKSALRADENIEKMQGLAFATKTVGIDLEKLGDISKDTREKIGDFLNTGGGGFQDFADALRLTKEEAAAVAEEFKTLSGPEILQQMVNRMQEAEVSAVQMSHALEGMASDTTDLIPLLLNNGEELKRLEERYNSLGVTISELDSQKIKALSEETAIFAATASGSMTKATAVLSDEISGVLQEFAGLSKDIGEIVVTAVVGYQALVTEATAAVFGLFRAAEIASLEASIAISETFGAGAINTVAELDKAINDFVVSATDGLVNLGTVDFLQDAAEPLDELKRKLEELIEDDTARDAFDVSFLEEQWEAAIEKINQYNEVVSEIPTGDDLAAAGGIGTPFKSADENDAELQSLMDRFASEEQLLTQKFEKEIEIAKNNKALLLELENEYIEALIELDLSEEERNQELFDIEIARHQDLLSQKLISEEQYLKSVDKLAVKFGKQDVSNTKRVNKDKSTSEQIYADTALQIGDQLFEGNKAIEAGIVVAKTGAAVMHQLGSGDPYTAFARGAAAAAIGALQLAQTLGAQKGGGAISAPSASAASSTSSADAVSGEIEVNETVTQGSNTISTSNNITITADDSDELAVAFANVINKKVQSGELILG